ncbi:MAG: PLP-dependent aminotransferase family protein [Lachnospiraceae bacterium]|nr:PLP-dependent aminotransferase family protein [Lachnospiraceae bacterium]
MYELTIQLDGNNKIPLYEQIYAYIKDEIKSGRIPCRTKLPSTRALAEHLMVSRSTVDMAYAQLVSEGYIESRPYCGYFVSEISLLFDINKTEWEEEEKTDSPREGEWIDFSPWGIDLYNFPFNAWRKISKNLLSADNKELFAPCSFKGELSLRQTICTYLYEARGVHCTPDKIILGAGNEYLLILLNQLLYEKPVVAMENPTYLQAYNVFLQNGNDIVPISVDKSGMDVKELKRSNAQVAYVMPSHQFPLGVVMPIKRRLELLEWTKEAEDRYIIEDDYDSEFRYLGKPIPALQGVDNLGKVIYMGTFSKSVAPSIRMSYMVLPDKLLSRFKEKISFYSQTVSKMDQMIINAFITEGYFERHLNKMRSVYRAKHDLVISMLKEYKNKIHISGENSGLHILVTIQNGMSEEKLIAKAKEDGVCVHGLSEYYIDKRNFRDGTVLIGFASLSMEEIEKGIKKLIKTWRLR